MKILTKLAVVIAVTLLIQGCVTRGQYRKLQEKYNNDISSSNAHIEDLRAANQVASQDTQQLQFENKTLRLKVQELTDKARVDDETLNRLKEKILRRLSGIEGPGVSVDPLTGKVTIEGEVLFSAGRAELKESAKKILNKVADAIKNEPGCYIQISGHTDTDKIINTADMWKSKSNFELAAYRALSVLLYLEDQGVDPARMFLCSFGEHRPKSGRKSENRRVEIQFIGTEESDVKEESAPDEEKPSGPSK